MAIREIARRVGAAPSTVRLTIRRFEAAGLTWPLPEEVRQIHTSDGKTEAGFKKLRGCRRKRSRASNAPLASAR